MILKAGVLAERKEGGESQMWQLGGGHPARRGTCSHVAGEVGELAESVSSSAQEISGEGRVFVCQ